MNRSIFWASILVVGAGLAGCAAPAPAPVPAPAVVAPAPAPMPPPPPQAQCSEAGAKFAIGQALSPQLEAAARTRAGATLSRVLKPGQAVTMEFNGARLNLEVDARNRLTAARCG